MITLSGVYDNGEIELDVSPDQNIPGTSEVLVTFLSGKKEVLKSLVKEEKDELSSLVASDEQDEEYYESIREYKRVKAHGDITIIEQDAPCSYPLFDYSQGGLSFISERKFNVEQKISAGITDPSNPDVVLMELEMEVRGMYSFDDGYKVGCMFLDPVDEDLWHGLLQFLT